MMKLVAVSAHSISRKACCLSIKHSQPGTASLELQFPYRGMGSVAAMLFVAAVPFVFVLVLTRGNVLKL